MFDFDFKGIEQALKTLGELPREVRTTIEKYALPKGAEVIAEEARTICPVQSGALKDSIKSEAVTVKGDTIVGRVSAGNREVYYPAMVEFGHLTGRSAGGGARTPVAPRPFMRPAFDSRKQEAFERIQSAIIDALNQRQTTGIP